MAAKNECEWSTRFDQRPTDVPARLDSYNEQEKGEAASYFEVTAAVKRGLSSSDSGSDNDFAMMFVPQNIPRRRPVSSSVALETSGVALLKASKPYFRLRSCRSSDLVHATNFDASAPVFNGTFQLVLTDSPYKIRRLKKSKNSAHDDLSFRDMKDTVEIIADLLRSYGHAILFCTAQQLTVWRTLF